MTIHILHITYDMNIGGTEQVIRNLVEGLDKTRFKSSIACIDGVIGPWGQELETKGFKHFCFKRQPGFDFQVIKALRKLLKTEKIDIVHCHQYTPYTYGWFASLFTGIPVIFTEHGRFYPDFSSSKRRFINPILQMRTALITAISQATKDALVKYEYLSANRIEVIYNGIADLSGKRNPEQDQALKQSLGFTESDIIFGTISRLDPIKNQSMMIKAFAEALKTQPHIKLLIVGDGPLREDLETLTRSLGIETNVTFTGFQPNPQSYLSIMDVFLLPSLSEGTSMTLLEAMSFSKPTIATAVGGTPEILKHKDTGMLTNNNNQEELEQAIGLLAAKEALRKSLGDMARQDYIQHFTVKAMTDNYQTSYSALTHKTD